MINSIFIFESTRSRQRSAPMLLEREEYLSYMLSEGVSKQRVRSIAAMLLNVIRLLDLKGARPVHPDELERAAHRWLLDSGSHKTRKAGTSSVWSFQYTARNWLKFHNLISPRAISTRPLDITFESFVQFLTKDRGLSPKTIRTSSSRVRHLLVWSEARHTQLSQVCLRDVDEYLAARQAEGCRPRTIASYCAAFRMFFRFMETLGGDGAHIARGIQSPRISRYDQAPRGPAWKDVRRLLDCDLGMSPAGLRASAILSLCAIYGLRSSEVVNLMLSDFDWHSETFTIRRAKRGRVQQFPIQWEVGESILRYLRWARPQCPCRRLFVTLRPPYRPVQSSTTWAVVGPRLKQLGIEAEHFGVHALRHACATELLNRGCSLKDIADFLGHRDMKSVSVYAKYDVSLLRQVANFSLAELT